MATLRNSSSWMGNSPKTTPPRTGYNTISGATSPSQRRVRLDKGFFDEPDELQEELQGIVGLGKADEGWHVSLAKSESRSRSSKKRDNLYTVYVSTPTSSMTLMRTATELVDLEAKLRMQLPGRLPARKSTPQTPVTPPATPRKRSSVLASLQRTLSPRRGQREPSSFSSVSSKESSVLSVDHHELGSLLSTLSHDSAVRTSTAWRSFFQVRRDDLESARVEKRIKRTKSDVTTHLASSRPSSEVVAVGGGAPPSSAWSMPGQEGEAQHLSLFPLPHIPSSKLDFQAADHDGGAAVALDVDLGEGERRVASSSTDITHMTTSSEAAAGIDLPTPPALHRADPIASISPPTPAAEEEVMQLPTPPSTEPETPAEVAPHSSQTIAIPSSPSNLSSALKSPARSRTASKSASAKAALTIESFDILRVLGKGCAGKVLLVRQKGSDQLYALKAIHKQHVLAHRELAHTKTEQAVLKACSRSRGALNPFVVRLHYSFHDKDTLYLALDFHPGGDLATQLARWGRLGRDRTRFYTAEIVEGVEGLHKAGVIYRDLKPENILISQDGHVVLTDFGLSKDFNHGHIGNSSPRSVDSASLSPADDGALPTPRPHWLSAESSSGGSSVSSPPSMSWLVGRRETTSTFCGTAEYLAPEVLLGEPYSYEVDAWSLGTMLYEMLAGVTPFWSEDHATMYRRVLHEDLSFEDAPRVFDEDTKSLLRGLLQRDPLLRMTDSRMKRNPYFAAIDWDHVLNKRYVAPFIPTLNPDDPSDTSQFDEAFLGMEPEVGEGVDGDGKSERDPPEGEPQEAFDGEGRDVFDGYSYYGRDSDSIRRSESEEESEEEEEDDEMTSVHQHEQPVESADVTMEQDDLLSPNAAGHPDTTLSTFDSDTTEATTALEASPVSKRVRQPSEDQELGSLAGSGSLPSLSSVAGASLAPPLPPTTTSTTADIILEDVDEEGSSDSEWDVVGAEMETEVNSGTGGTTPLGRAFPTARNGGREATLWARGFKDKYRLAIKTPSSPLRPPISRKGSRNGSSTYSIHSTSRVSPSTTPEPPRSTSSNPIRRLASVRSASSGTIQQRKSHPPPPPSSVGSSAAGGRTLGSRKSQRSLRVEDAENLEEVGRGPTRSMPSSPSMSALETPRKAGQAIKRLTLSAFRPARA